MKKTILITSAIFTNLFFQLGCTNPFGEGKSRISNNYGPDNSTTAPASYGVISGSNQGGKTTNNRIVQISAGATAEKLKLKTNNNRIVYLSVQGQLISQ